MAGGVKELLEQARVHHRAGRMDGAVRCYELVLRTEPLQPDALIGLADALEALGRNSEVIKLLEQSLTQSSSSALVQARLADAFQVEGDFPCAIEAYRDAVLLDQSLPGAWWGLGCAQASLGDHANATESFQHLLTLQPRNGLALVNVGKSLFELGQVDPAIDAFRKSIDHLSPEMHAVPLGSIAVAIPGSSTATNQDVLDARRAWATRYLPLAPADRIFPGRTADPNRPLRLGYVSSFFAKRNWMKPVWGLIDHHDHNRFLIHVFSDGPEPDSCHGYKQSPRASFHNVNSLSNAELAQFIEDQAIDLLVDLNAFSRPSRLPLFALRPAPVQVAWFNLFAPSGMTCFDYLIGDAHVIAVADEIFYSESIMRVPGSYTTFQVPYPVPDVATAPCLKNGHLTFGCLAPQYKITTSVIEAWSQILRESPTTRLVLKNVILGEPAARDLVHRLFARFSIPAERVELDGPDEHYAFLERYADIDVALDTFPYNGGTTTTEALWQGVPVLAFMGDRWAARISGSILRAAGLSEFLAPDLDAFVAHAIALARDPNVPARLDSIRRTMRDRLRASSVCDVSTFARNMEEIYLDMWRRHAERP